jgi:uncharacterized protein YjiS (DUF1127 family)
METVMAYTTINDIARNPAPIAGSTLVARLTTTLQQWRQRAHDRAELARLTGRDARDLGLDPGMISYEASKPFWRA